MRGTTIAILVLAVIGATGHVWRNGRLAELAFLPAAWTKAGSAVEGPSPSSAGEAARLADGEPTRDPQRDEAGEAEAPASAATPAQSRPRRLARPIALSSAQPAR